MASVRPPSHRPISAVAPTATTMPITTRVTTYCQDSTRAKKTNTAGFNKGLPAQAAKGAPEDTPARRRPAITGAAKEVHIRLGIDKLQPTTDCSTAVGLFITRTNQTRRTSAS